MRNFRRGDCTYRFLFDEDVKILAPLFQKKRVRTLAQVRLPATASDRAIVRMAWGRQFIIVTGNKRDFKKAIAQFRAEQRECPCMFGLLALPSGEEIQKRVLTDFKDLERDLRFKGQRTTWKAVHQKNYMVRAVRKGKPQVTELPLCSECTKDSGR